MPDGSPLELKFNSTPTERDKQLDELWKRSMDDIGIRFSVRKAQWPDLLKESNAGKLMFWQLGGAASSPDADTWLTSLYGPNAGFKGNRARFSSRPTTASTRRRARCPTAPSAPGLPGDGEARGGVRAVEDQHAPHPHRPLVPVGGRLPPPAGAEPAFLEVHRHRPEQDEWALGRGWPS
jgi:hypothetical protein